MIRVSDAANTSNTNDAATQRNTRFVKFRKFVKLRLNLATLTAAALITIGLAPLPALAVIHLGSANSTSLANGLVGYWPLDGAVTNWTTNTTRDLSGNGNTGQLIGMSTTTSPTIGQTGQALNLKTNQSVQVPISSSLQFASTTISFWGKVAGTAPAETATSSLQ